MTTIIITNAVGSIQRFGYASVLENDGAVITGSSETDGYEVTNAYDWKPYTYWIPSAGGTQYITVALDVADGVNYLGLHGHNFGDIEAVVTLQYSTNAGVDWDDACEVNPVNNDTIYQVFDAIVAADWRLRVVSVDPCRLAVFAIGVDMQPEVGDWVGITPPILGRATKLTNTMSENGVFLGRSVKQYEYEFGVNLDFLTPAFIREEWLPFVLVAEVRPFFYHWNYSDYPDEPFFSWADGAIQKPAYSRQRYMSAGIRMKGVYQ